MYYLKSRYYAPEICRFINADSYLNTGQGFVGNNMFAYCLNTRWEKSITGFVFFAYDVYSDICGLISPAPSNASEAKKSDAKSAVKTSVDTAEGTASPPPTGKGNNNQDKNYSGGSTYDRNGIRIDYEYYDNGNGNVHVHTSQGKLKYDFSSKLFFTESGGIAPKAVQSLMNNPEYIKAVYKAFRYISM